MTTPADRMVVSPDGTSIVVRETGAPTGSSIADLAKPTVIVIGSAFDDLGSPYLGALAERLADRFRVVRYDRRGRGASGDTAPWSVQREVEDLAAVVRSVGGPVSLLGLCTGAGLVLQAVAAGVDVERAVVHEPPYRATVDPDEDDVLLADRLDELVRAGRRSTTLRAFLVRVLGMPVSQVAAMRLRPTTWRRLLTVAPFLPREVRTMTMLAVPERLLGAIGIPVLVMAGTDSPDWMKLAVRAVVEAVPGSEHTVLAGQGHLPDAEVLAPAVERFLLR